VYGRTPRRAAKVLAGALMWSVTKRLSYLRAQRRGSEIGPQLRAALRRFAAHPDVIAILLLASAAAAMGERRLVKLKEFVMVRAARTRS
jgi:hypothetical protein